MTFFCFSQDTAIPTLEIHFLWPSLAARGNLLSETHVTHLQIASLCTFSATMSVEIRPYKSVELLRNNDHCSAPAKQGATKGKGLYHFKVMKGYMPGPL